jgi:hypothetical protein
VTTTEQERPAAMPDPTAEPAAPAEPVVRPAPHRWLWYSLGGRLPRRNRGWVLHDTTTGSWWLRHVLRILIQLALPIALILALLPASWALRAAAVGGGIFLAMIYGLAYMTETVENRVVKAGYPAGTAAARREQRSLGRQQRETERKRAAAARRAARYRDRMGR